jgi:hypothetical protein
MNAWSANPTVYEWQYLTEYDQYNNFLEGFLLYISQDFLIATSQLPWPLVSRCNDKFLRNLYWKSNQKNVQEQALWKWYKNTKT